MFETVSYGGGDVDVGGDSSNVGRGRVFLTSGDTDGGDSSGGTSGNRGRHFFYEVELFPHLAPITDAIAVVRNELLVALGLPTTPLSSIPQPPPPPSVPARGDWRIERAGLHIGSAGAGEQAVWEQLTLLANGVLRAGPYVSHAVAVSNVALRTFPFRLPPPHSVASFTSPSLLPTVESWAKIVV
jgi:hypothetical protein